MVSVKQENEEEDDNIEQVCHLNEWKGKEGTTHTWLRSIWSSDDETSEDEDEFSNKFEQETMDETSEDDEIDDDEYEDGMYV